jgi:hypothetical protein
MRMRIGRNHLLSILVLAVVIIAVADLSASSASGEIVTELMKATNLQLTSTGKTLPTLPSTISLKTTKSFQTTSSSLPTLTPLPPDTATAPLPTATAVISIMVYTPTPGQVFTLGDSFVVSGKADGEGAKISIHLTSPSGKPTVIDTTTDENGYFSYPFKFGETTETGQWRFLILAEKLGWQGNSVSLSVTVQAAQLTGQTQSTTTAPRTTTQLVTSTKGTTTQAQTSPSTTTTKVGTGTERTTPTQTETATHAVTMTLGDGATDTTDTDHWTTIEEATTGEAESTYDPIYLILVLIIIALSGMVAWKYTPSKHKKKKQTRRKPEPKRKPEKQEDKVSLKAF